MSTFEVAITAARHILSAVTPPEAQLLFDYAMKTSSEKAILEVGSDKGFSTVILANTDRKVVAVDPHIAREYRCEETGQGGAHTVQDYADFIVNTKNYPNIRHIRKCSIEVDLLEISEPIGFMFIDANHAWPHPKADFLHFAKLLSAGDYVAWHDYGTFPGVTRSVQQLEQEHRLELIAVQGTMAMTRLL